MNRRALMAGKAGLVTEHEFIVAIEKVTRG